MFQKIKTSFTLFILIFCIAGCQLISVNKKKIKKKKKPPEIIKEEKPKIGLFISGAGANTFSVISLLELFQKNKIHFDFISGTGWGAWLAAVYAKNQNVDELKWNLFKLKEQGVFGTKWFSNKKKRVKILTSITKEALPSPLNTAFVCPALSKKRQFILWLKEQKPALATFNCLNKLPPLFFLFENTKGYGSLFSADLTLKYMREKGMDTLIWIRPSLSLKDSPVQDITFSIFWEELTAHLNSIQKQQLHQYPQTIILETNTSPFSLYDFFEMNTIMKSPAPLSAGTVIDKLKKIKGKLKTSVPSAVPSE